MSNINISKRWVLIFKALSNVNRLKIIKLLFGGQDFNVSEISSEINISFNATSKHLIILSSLDFIDSIGRDGHVFYRLNPNLPKDIKSAIDLFV